MEEGVRLMICFHNWGRVEEGYQYCTKCGLAKKVQCRHIWKEIYNSEVIRRSTGAVIGYCFILQCSHCGEIQEKRVDI